VTGAHLDLALALGAKCWFIDGQQHQLIVIRQHHAVETTVNSADVLSHKLGKLVEPCGCVGFGLQYTAVRDTAVQDMRRSTDLSREDPRSSRKPAE
jgi:hypothetical protein